MKLLLCNDCGDLFNLTYLLKSCHCGKTKGKYLDHSEAVVNGGGISLAIGNGALHNAVLASTIPAASRGVALEQNRITHAWVRAHEGPENPHTRVDKTLGT